MNEIEKKFKTIIELNERLHKCDICPRQCNVDRRKSFGFCKSGIDTSIAYFCIHKGEEPPISGTNGSGCVFFNRCNLSCVYCQNYQISQEVVPKKNKSYNSKQLSKIFLKLQKLKAHNINLVSPTHFAPQIIKAIFLAKANGLKIPIVYNSNGFEHVEIIDKISPFIDIFLPDLKYFNNKTAIKYSNARNYFSIASRVIKKMFQAKGPLVLDNYGIAKQGVLVRHLILPGMVNESLKILDFLSSISNKIGISILSQFAPLNKSANYPEINRFIQKKEYDKVVQYAEKLGFENAWKQELDSSINLIPNFKRKDPFKNSF